MGASSRNYLCLHYIHQRANIPHPI